MKTTGRKESHDFDAKHLKASVALRSRLEKWQWEDIQWNLARVRKKRKQRHRNLHKQAAV
jgi:hypothetical protein